MKSYEVLYIVKPIDEDVYSATIEKIEKVIADNGGELVKTDNWGKKRLAYEVQDFNDGYYALTTFNAEPATVKELDRVMKITEEILRHMIIRKGE